VFGFEVGGQRECFGFFMGMSSVGVRSAACDDSEGIVLCCF
jgi:hypothetical protein